ncbi:hypothetical protein PROFUN_16629 [Planoprotostelium fungivorum]|uniref:Uncharacterized protein n=1 Tax=Planoprotostelium fungivorum TaxID=1890364 RepID=A0A2P6MQ73_9EUKA|nr:hypothetical protein PROFUN_16629 [Planoprotostelium fungivorum]
MEMDMMTVQIRRKSLFARECKCQSKEDSSKAEMEKSGFLQLKMLSSAEWTNKYAVIPKGQWPVLWLFDKASKITSDEKSGKVYPLHKATFFFFLQASYQTDRKAWLQVLTDKNVVDVSRAESKMVESTLSVVTAFVDENCNMSIGTFNLRGLQHGEGGLVYNDDGSWYEGSFDSGECRPRTCLRFQSEECLFLPTLPL